MYTLCTPSGEDDALAAADLLEGTYWNAAYSRETLARAHLGSTVWVGARDGQGRLIASARALSDGAKLAWIYDVIVAEQFRQRGIARAMIAALLEDRMLREVKRIMLATRDAQPLYAQFGFRDLAELPPRPFRSTEMVLLR